MLLFPFLLVAAGLYFPYSVWLSYVQRRNSSSHQTKMKVLGRVIDWHDFVRSLGETRGTAIVERYSFAGPVHLWWTSENIYDLCPFPSVDWWALHDESFLPFAEWCRARYTNPDTGSALLVGPVPKGVGPLPTLFESAETGSRERWIEIVPRKWWVRDGERRKISLAQYNR